MKILGLDIGTTTISAVVVEGTQVLDALTLPNGSFLPTPKSWEKIQNVAYIHKTALGAVDSLLEKHPDVQRIGITGQMHGIVYLNTAGEPVSPLYIWQDGRGEQLYGNGQTYAAYLSKLTGYALSTGYGTVTHFYNQCNGLVPEDATVFCTIHDYIAMVLAGRSRPVTDPSDGASLGMFDVAQGCFDEKALALAQLDPAILPQLAQPGALGAYRGKYPVYAAIGDNQASFLGASGGDPNCMLVNMGTGGQFSAFTRAYLTCEGLETRPFPGGGYLLVGASLCGGRAYALLESFLRQTAEMVTGNPQGSCYDAMAALLGNGEKPRDLPTVTPLFQGTRQDPSLTGSITGLTTENLTPKHLLWAWMTGMAEELNAMYRQYLAAGGLPAPLIGSGNGLRRNVYLQQCFADAFGTSLTMSECSEEAACGAAQYAAMQ